MELEKDPLKPVAQALVETYNNIQKHRRPMVEELAGASGTRRAMVVAAIEFGRTAEECCHIALKAAGFNPAFCQVQTLNFECELSTTAAAGKPADRWQASASIAEVVTRALGRMDEFRAYYAKLRAEGEPGAVADSTVDIGLYPNPAVLHAFVLPLVEAQHAKVRARRMRAALPVDLTARARLHCADRLLKRISDALACAHGRNPHSLPTADDLRPTYSQAVSDGDQLALAAIADLYRTSAGEYKATWASMLRLDDEGTKYGFALATEFLVQLVAPLLGYDEPTAAGK